ncbi:MAG: hypothetical protein JXP36_03730, partial [Bacteroidales bacterium]|nr:hypothetical protein [Bacteroidales bacterium]
QWFEHICSLISIKSDLNVRTADLVDINNCLSTGGTAGAYKNGDGSVMGNSDFLAALNWSGNVLSIIEIKQRNENSHR